MKVAHESTWAQALAERHASVAVAAVSHAGVTFGGAAWIRRRGVDQATPLTMSTNIRWMRRSPVISG
ncbi:hypothetical protein BST29_17740 [Mycobacterium malmoense]|uniref:Uncharacterized protein n=1 Tax=Mycobacterium malmoense TaxID=1780 RepID=A0ABX3SNK8_MYCMA|nr:hypothetical protein BST29_17740 [Mycobacterium malmoense]